MEFLFISDKEEKGKGDSWAWKDLFLEDEKEYEELRKQGKLIDIDEEDGKKSFIDILKGSAGSGSWDGPANPRFPWTGKEKPKIERFAGKDPRLSPQGKRKEARISEEGGKKVIKISKTGDTIFQTKREPDTITIDKKGKEKVVPGKLTMADGSPLPKNLEGVYIPPAWSEVYVSKDGKMGLQAEGIDKKGRIQPAYAKDHKELKSVEKQSRVNGDLSPQFDSLYKKVNGDTKSTDLKVREASSCLKLIMSTGIRPTDENEGSKLADKKAFGAITMLGQHVSSSGGKVYVELPAKKGTMYKAEIKDASVAKDLMRRKKLAGDDGRIYNTSQGKVLNYSKARTGFVVKDYRTLVANREADKIMSKMKKPKNETELKKAIKDVTKHVSGVLCNTPGMAYDSYIDKKKWSQWEIKKSFINTIAKRWQ